MMSSRKGRLVRHGSHNTSELTRVSEEDPYGVAAASKISPDIRTPLGSLQMKGTCILAMGLTGAGKSTFISQLTQQTVPIGHSLGSCTVEVYGYPYQRPNGDVIWLVDTPGFDDANKANPKILRDIVSFICFVGNDQHLRIGGMLYFHRITDIRMSSSSLKCLRVFEKLCGADAFKDVTIVTTMWDMLQSEDAIREAELRANRLQQGEKQFGHLCKGGAAYEKHENSPLSGIKIIENMCNRARTVRPLVQLELQGNRTFMLADTAVGRYLEGDFSDTRRKYQNKKSQVEALSKDLEVGADDLAAELARQYELIRDLHLSMSLLSVTYDDLRKEWEGKISEDSLSIRDSENGGRKSSLKDYKRQILPQEVTKDVRDASHAHRLGRKPEGSPVRDRSIRERPKRVLSPSPFQHFLKGLMYGPNETLIHEKPRSTSVPAGRREWRLREDKPNRQKRTPQSRERRKARKSSHQDSLQSTDCESDTSVVQQADLRNEEDEDDEDEEEEEEEEEEDIVFFEAQPLLPRSLTTPHFQNSTANMPHKVYHPNPPTHGGHSSIADCNPSLTRTPRPPRSTYMMKPPDYSRIDVESVRQGYHHARPGY